MNDYWKRKGLNVQCDPIIIGEGNSHCRGSGGDVTFNRLKTELSVAMTVQDDAPLFFTTIFDFYERHGEWPRESELSEDVSAQEKVEQLEIFTKEALISELQGFPIEDKFIPYFMLHEYEGLMFSDPSAIVGVTKSRSSEAELQKVLSDFGNKPEAINTELSPSQRIKNAKVQYGKTTHAHRIISQIGIDNIRQSCPHFDGWLIKLERLLTSDV